MGAKIASTFYHKGVVTKMDTVILNNGVEMPMIGIGTSMLDEEACERTVREALEMGYRFVDTAQSYRNEGAVGRAVRQSGVKRKDVFIATKLTIANTTYEKAKESCKRSLDRLGVSAIDLLLLQYPYNDVFGAWRALTELREEGLVHAIGAVISPPTVSLIWCSTSKNGRRSLSSSAIHIISGHSSWNICGDRISSRWRAVRSPAARPIS